MRKFRDPIDQVHDRLAILARAFFIGLKFVYLAKCGIQMHQKAIDVVVVGIEIQPGRRDLISTQLAVVLQHRRGFPEAGGAMDENEFGRRSAKYALTNLRALNVRARLSRRPELGSQHGDFDYRGGLALATEE